MEVTKMLVGIAVAVVGGAVIGAVTNNGGAGVLTAIFIGGGYYVGDTYTIKALA